MAVVFKRLADRRDISRYIDFKDRYRFFLQCCIEKMTKELVPLFTDFNVMEGMHV